MVVTPCNRYLLHRSENGFLGLGRRGSGLGTWRANMAQTEQRHDLDISSVIGQAKPARRVLALSDPAAADSALTGAKASALARAQKLGLPVVDGFVLTTETTSELPLVAARLAARRDGDLRRSWERLSAAGRIPLAVRSSSVAEDGEVSSMAGMFTSVIGVRSWSGFCRAVIEVIVSATPKAGDDEAAPIAVLVQPVVAAVAAGVMFGLDPLSGRRDRIVIAAVEGSPEALVSGEVDGNRYVLTTQGRVVRVDTGYRGAALGGKRRRALAHLAARAEAAFGSPQDVEWAFDADDRLWLFQSRPVTAVERQPEPKGPVLGPGPIAETFPAALSTLEQELWLEPMRAALVEALGLLRTAASKRVESSPVVTSVKGRPAADLELLGIPVKKRSWLAKLDPRPPSRRLLASWNAGRLRAALPSLSRSTMELIDTELAAVPPASEMDDLSLVELMRRCRRALKGLHGHEVLAGMLLRNGASAVPGAAVALRVLVEGRRSGVPDSDLAARHPIILVLTPPTTGAPAALPAVTAAAPVVATNEDELASAREQLRTRARWVQELSAIAAREVGRRFVRSGKLEDASEISHLTLEELEELARDEAVVEPDVITQRRRNTSGAPLPAAFRLADGDRIVPVSTTADEAEGRGAGGGRAKGKIVHDAAKAGPGDILVVRTLDPDLASVLPSLTGLIAETGSVLSHLAILAREFGVPTVVGSKDALKQWAEGTDVVIDGASGSVEELDEEGVA
jgi:rifampicin phosphotransferase